jgi:hypothetical protein
MQFNFRADPELIIKAGQLVDGIQFRSVGQILNIALEQWLSTKKKGSKHDTSASGRVLRGNRRGSGNKGGDGRGSKTATGKGKDR